MSVELQKLRQELLREALLKGWTRASDVQAPWTQQLESSRIEHWYKRLYKTAEVPLPVGQRLVNHFTLGADPEFVFHNGSERTDARTLGLKAGPAFGADNNGRLCELRPAPSRSALSVLASLWLAMRWMTVFHPDVLRYSWRSGCYFAGDGLGGHVHFGRKRLKFRDREVAALDRLAHLQFVAGIFDREEGRLRVRQAQGAPMGQPYGALGDIRLQPHGYEYRTLPSWIDNPWLAYFNLVTTKLVVAFPDLVAPLGEADAAITAEQARAQLRLLLAYYSPLDDDARLASAILAHRGLPVHASGLDFKTNWGLFATGPFGHKPEAPAPNIWPSVVPSTPQAEMELSQAMFEARQPELGSLSPTWPSQLPEGYVHLICSVDTKLAPGLGELAMGLCTHTKFHCPKWINMGHSHWAFRFPPEFAAQGTKVNLLGRLNVPADFGGEHGQIQVNASKDYDLERLEQAKKEIVDSQIFPLWRLQDVQSDSLQKWQAQAQTSNKKLQPRGHRVEFSGHEVPNGVPHTGLEDF